jgi:hypothetical protein
VSIQVQNKGILRIALATAVLLLLPFLAMQFTHEVTWTPADFAVAGALLFGAGLTYELLARRGATTAYRAAVGLAVVTGLVLVWMNLAVGLIGDEDNPANLMYAGVLAVGLAGALIARLRPRGMAYALYATAAAQMLTAVVAQVAGWGFTFVLNGFFALLWIGAGLLFRRAGDAGAR